MFLTSFLQLAFVKYLASAVTAMFN